MVVMWCRSCGALIGLRHPLEDWSTKRTGVCAPCAVKLMRDRLPTEGEPVSDVVKETNLPTGEPG
jgi:hypothetical protein